MAGWCSSESHVAACMLLRSDASEFPLEKLAVPVELSAKDSEEAELMKMANAITAVPFHLQREFTDSELVEFKRCFDQIDVDGSGAVDASEMAEALVSLGEVLPTDKVEQAIREVDANGNGEIEFDEFVQMIFNMRSGVSEVQLAMVYRTVPQGNEISKDAAAKVDERLHAMWKANRRLEARRVFWGIDGDDSGEIDAMELKTALNQLGLRTTIKQVRDVIREFDDNHNGTVDLQEFLAHFDEASESSKHKKGLQWFLQQVTNYRHKAAERVTPIAASRFAQTFTRRCRKVGVVIKEELRARLGQLHTDPLVAKGILDLKNCRLRDTHFIALCFTLKAVPIFWQLRLTGNYVTDAGMNALVRTLEYQLHDANFVGGAGGADKVVDAKLRPTGWAVADELDEAGESTVQPNEDDPWAVPRTRRSLSRTRGSSRGSSRGNSRGASRGLPRSSSDALNTARSSNNLLSSVNEDGDSKASAGMGAGGAGAGTGAEPLSAMRKAMASLRSFDSDDSDDGEGKHDGQMGSSYSLRGGGGNDTSQPTSARKGYRNMPSLPGMVGGEAGVSRTGSGRRLTKHGSGVLSRKLSVGMQSAAAKGSTTFTPGAMFTPSQRDLMRVGVRSHDIITCSDCGAMDVKTPTKPGGKAEKFVVFANVTQCRNCDHEWIQPVHYLTDVDIVDPMKVRRCAFSSSWMWTVF